MSKMQAEAATAVPGHAPVAAYLDHLPQAIPADLLGYLIATEAKAVHQVRRKTAAFKPSRFWSTRLVPYVCLVSLDCHPSGTTAAPFVSSLRQLTL